MLVLNKLTQREIGPDHWLGGDGEIDTQAMAKDMLCKKHLDITIAFII
jgi:hypothetical protein